MGTILFVVGIAVVVGVAMWAARRAGSDTRRAGHGDSWTPSGGSGYWVGGEYDHGRDGRGPNDGTGGSSNDGGGSGGWGGDSGGWSGGGGGDSGGGGGGS